MLYHMLLLVVVPVVSAGTVYSRYLTLYSPDADSRGARIINLQEVEAYDADTGELMKPMGITASSNHPAHPVRQMIDGSMDTFGHTFMYDSGIAWVQIDYGAGRAFGKIVLLNRGGSDGITVRAVGMQVTLSAVQCDKLSAKSSPDCSGAGLWTETLTSVAMKYTFDRLPDAGSPTTTTTMSTTTASSTTVTNHLVPKVVEMQDKLSKVELVIEEQIKQNEAEVNTLKSTIQQQDETIGELQDTLAEQATQFAAYKQANNEQKALVDSKFAELYKALSALSEPLPESMDADPNRKCAPGNAQPDTAIEVSGTADDRVLSMTVCDGKVELNSAECTADPCAMQRYIQILKTRLAALTDV